MKRAGWDTLRVGRIDDLLHEDERKKLHDDLAQLARVRVRVEVEGRCLPMA